MSSQSQSRPIPGVGFLCGTQNQHCGCHPEIPVSLYRIPQSHPAPQGSGNLSSQGINPTCEGIFSTLQRKSRVGFSQSLHLVTLEVFSNTKNSIKSKSGHFYTTPAHKSSPVGRFLVFQEGIPACSTAPCRNYLQSRAGFPWTHPSAGACG